MKTRNVFFASIAALILGACANSSGGAAPVPEGPLGASNPVRGTAWKDVCQTWGGGAYISSGLNVFTVGDSTFTITGNSFGTNDCKGALTTQMKMTASYTVMKTADPTVFNFDVVIQTVSQTMFDQDTANMFNTAAYCGFTDWVVGVEKVITNLSCFSGPKSGETIFSIAKVSAAQMQLGEPDAVHDGKTPAGRHAVLDAKIFTKQ